MDIHLSTMETVLLISAVVWELGWKGLALWLAARDGQRTWFIALLAISSLGILPMFYIALSLDSKTKEETDEAPVPIEE